MSNDVRKVIWTRDAAHAAGRLAIAAEQALEAKAEGLGVAMQNLRRSLALYDDEIMKMGPVKQ